MCFFIYHNYISADAVLCVTPGMDDYSDEDADGSGDATVFSPTPTTYIVYTGTADPSAETMPSWQIFLVFACICVIIVYAGYILSNRKRMTAGRVYNRAAPGQMLAELDIDSGDPPRYFGAEMGHRPPTQMDELEYDLLNETAVE